MTAYGRRSPLSEYAQLLVWLFGLGRERNARPFLLKGTVPSGRVLTASTEIMHVLKQFLCLSSFVYVSFSSSRCEQAPCCILPLSAIYLPQGTCYAFKKHLLKESIIIMWAILKVFIAFVIILLLLLMFCVVFLPARHVGNWTGNFPCIGKPS